MKKHTFILIIVALALQCIGSIYYAYKVNDFPTIDILEEEKENHVVEIMDSTIEIMDRNIEILNSDNMMLKELVRRKQCNK